VDQASSPLIALLPSGVWPKRPRRAGNKGGFQGGAESAPGREVWPPRTNMEGSGRCRKGLRSKGRRGPNEPKTGNRR